MNSYMLFTKDTISVAGYRNVESKRMEKRNTIQTLMRNHTEILFRKTTEHESPWT